MQMLIGDWEVMGPRVNFVPFNLVAWGSAAVMIALSLLALIAGLACGLRWPMPSGRAKLRWTPG
jgi:hypothetical protein